MPTARATVQAVSEFALDVRAGLARAGQKTLPPKYFYDDVGSALFEAISVLPEYGLTRADERLLRKHSNQIVGRLGLPVVVAELGSGSGRKTRWILESLSPRQATFYYPIEISPAALAVCQRELSDIDSVTVIGLEREYLDGLSAVAGGRQRNQQLLVLFLGSSVGNLEHSEAINFLTQVRGLLMTGDTLLLGTDLEKPVPQLLAAYDDAAGVTRAFNLNLLARINRELDADFKLEDFEHTVKFNGRTHSVEMHLRSRRRQTVAVRKLHFSVTFDEDETILTETSHKYSLEEAQSISEETGFRCAEQFVDREWPFAESLLIAK
ncbi:MAG: L-histidine N(alpha)-methyltransferase [Terriglobia bacterium]